MQDDAVTHLGPDSETRDATRQADFGDLVPAPDRQPSKISSPATADDEDSDQGGDPACWAHLVCQECGAFVAGSPHQADCSCSGDDDEET